MTLTIADSGVVIDRDTHTIIVTRVLAAPCEQVFEAWTRPEHVTCWWDPTGEPLAECEIDLRPGGTFRFLNRHSAATHQFAGVYREIAPPRHLIFEAMGAIGRVTFDETAGGTRLTMRIECGSAERLDQYLKMGIDTGTAKTLDNLVVYVRATPQRTSSALSDVPSTEG
ncbi:MULTISPECIES: SRPBCC domain-containing protein [unclassified Rhizobium]|uniref:SRPBCC domain-containing protein n=1 Tax=unclassified Rhizobium TaxID=2613769 RepID=UPI000EA908A1|nr:MULTISPECIES: SRPBCC domain-containing protein [unclassified Rhizobium]AYG64933.1 ATPase [Rhizobium sp. CCGE531]AYG71418.1 ATPase [Rhizobium sp. CCGE532]